MRLTPHFELNELIYSSTAEKLGIANTPTAKVIRNLSTLCQTVLEPLRVAYGKPIYITSGYRGKALNVAVGGARNSDHLHGCAADITTRTKDGNKALWNIIIKKANAGELHARQIIDESNLAWIHISINAMQNSVKHNQILQL